MRDFVSNSAARTEGKLGIASKANANSNASNAKTGEKRRRSASNATSAVKRQKTSPVLKSGKSRNSLGTKTPAVKTPKARSGTTGTTPSRARATKTREGGESRIDEEDECESDKENVRTAMEGGEWGARSVDSGGRVLFDECEAPSPKPIEEMSPGQLEMIVAKSPSSMRLGNGFDNDAPQSPLAAAFAMISEFLESPKRERQHRSGANVESFWGLAAH